MTTLKRMGAAAALAAALGAPTALADKGGVPNGGDGTDNPNAAQAAQPAQPAVAPAVPAQPAPKAKAKAKKPKPAKPAKAQKAKSHGAKAVTPASAPAPAPQAKAGKTTICHATGSDTNPYVTITISDNALKAHARHQDGRDIIPAPAGGCPAGEDGAAAPADKGKGHAKAKAGKTTICHATGSETNPYVKITISDNAVKAHARHQDGRDIIPAPEGDCPAEPAAAAAPTAEGTASAPASGEPVIAGASLDQPVVAPADHRAQLRAAVLGVSATAPATDVAGAGDTADDTAGGIPAARVSEPRDVAGLPFTGLELLTVALLGTGLLLAGFALRRAAAGRAAL